MPTFNKTGRSKSGPAFVQLFQYMLKSPAWLGLTPQERAVYVEIASRYNGRNNGFIGMSVRHAAARCNIAPNTAAKALKALQEAGFIACTERGNFNLKRPIASEYRLTTFKCDKTGEVATKDFMKPKASSKETVSKSAPPVPCRFDNSNTPTGSVA
jgi:hypothetical protein